MQKVVESYLDEQFLDVLRNIVEEAWRSVPKEVRLSKSEMAGRILDAAQKGERDHERLRQAAMRRP